MGRTVVDIPLLPYSGTQEYDVSALPESIYACQLLIGGRMRAAGKIIVLH